MAISAITHSPPPDVAAALKACPKAAAAQLDAVRAMIFQVAADTPKAGRIVETLKWGQPSYLTEKPKSGTTIRLGWDDAGAHLHLFVHCQTTLINDWRDRYGDVLTFVGNRQVLIPTEQNLPRAPLQHCIAMALTYHQRKTSE